VILPSEGAPDTPQRPERKMALFPMGEFYTTQGVIDTLDTADILSALRRHLSGDWGDLCDEDKKANDEALRLGDRLFSSYHAVDGTKFWIITERDRSLTTVLLPSEY
jgi:hypothetical protein